MREEREKGAAVWARCAREDMGRGGSCAGWKLGRGWPAWLGRERGRSERGEERRVLGLRARKRVKGFCLFIFYFLFFHSKAIFKPILKSL